jgi:hypothetical protein
MAQPRFVRVVAGVTKLRAKRARPPRGHDERPDAAAQPREPQRPTGYDDPMTPPAAAVCPRGVAVRNLPIAILATIPAGLGADPLQAT